MRLFTAIPLPPDIVTFLQSVQAKLMQRPLLQSTMTLVPPQSLHATLKFLGEVPEQKLPALIQSLERIPFQKMNFTVNRFLCFPTKGPARILAATLLGDNKPLEQLVDWIERATVSQGFPREQRPFKPHITLGRFKSPTRTVTSLTLARAVDPFLLPSAQFEVNEFRLVQSHLNPTGATYTTLRTFTSLPTDNWQPTPGN